MPEVRYQVPGVNGTPAFGISAFTPGCARPASNNLAYKYAVYSSLGRYPVPAPTVNTAPSPDIGDLANAGTSRSSDAPDQWYPQQSYQAAAVEWPGAGMPVRVYDPVHPGATTVLPMPASSLRGPLQSGSARLARRALLQRVRELPWFPRLYRAPAAKGAGNG